MSMGDLEQLTTSLALDPSIPNPHPPSPASNAVPTSLVPRPQALTAINNPSSSSHVPVHAPYLPIIDITSLPITNNAFLVSPTNTKGLPTTYNINQMFWNPMDKVDYVC